MKNLICFLRKEGLLCYLLFVAVQASAVSLQQALMNETVSLEANANNGKKINLILTNLLSTDQQIEIEAGTILTTGQRQIQQVMLVQPASALISGKATLPIQAYGMCINANRGGFNGKELYWEAQAVGNLKSVAEFVAGHELFNSVGQQAVWVVSNDHEIGGVYHADDETRLNIWGYLSGLTGKPMPWYIKHYEEDAFAENDTLTVFHDKVKSIEGRMEFEAKKKGFYTFGIYNTQGNLVTIFFRDKSADPGFHNYDFTWPTTKIKKGKYYARVWNEGSLVSQREIEI